MNGMGQNAQNCPEPMEIKGKVKLKWAKLALMGTVKNKFGKGRKSKMEENTQTQRPYQHLGKICAVSKWHTETSENL
jgi:hypothetical protein